MTPTRRGRWRALPTTIWTLGWVSLLMDVSSELVHALLPAYLVVGMGASMWLVGLIEGLAELTAAVCKLLSGALSDWWGRRKWLAALGYGLAALAKPIFPLAPTAGWILGARVVDRIGKGIRGAPRDALIADITPPELRGAAYGLRQALDTTGAFLGPLLAIALMAWLANDFVSVFWLAAIPAVLAALLVLLAVREPDRPKSRQPLRWPLRRAALAQLPAAYSTLLLLSALYSLARFSEAFLILRAQDAGLPLLWLPLVLVLLNLSYALSAYPLGSLSDRIDRRWLFAGGLVLLLLADLLLAWAPSLPVLALAVLIWGLHLGATQGLLARWVADVAPGELRGTAFGLLHLVNGAALLLASVLAGVAWSQAGPAACFQLGAGLALLCLLCFGLLHRRLEADPQLR
ncbi:MAG: MFS transporter [Lysobacterales bacterium]